MDPKFAHSWDCDRPVLREVLHPGVWDPEDHAAYLARLPEVLASAPPGGFEVLIDAREYTMQAESDADHQAYDLLAAAGATAMVMVLTKVAIAMQTARMVRESHEGKRLVFLHCSTMDEAERLLTQGRPQA